MPGPAKLPGPVQLDKVVPKLARRAVQLRGYALCASEQLLQALRSDGHPEPGPAVGAAKANGAGPFGGHAVGDSGRLLRALRSDVHPDPGPAAGAAKANGAGPFGGHALSDNGWLLQVFRRDCYPDDEAVGVGAKLKATREQKQHAESRGEGLNWTEPHRGLF